MRTSSQTILAVLSATLLMGVAVSSASGGRFSTSNTRFRVTWNTLRFLEVLPEGINLTCRVTLEGSFHSATIRKVPGALIGAITRGIADSAHCTSNNEPTTLTVLQESLPWHLTYESFSGTLPNIFSLTALLSRYAIQYSTPIFGIPIFCLYLDAGRPEENFGGNIARNTANGALTEFTILEGRRASFLRGTPLPEFCLRRWIILGSGQLFLLGNTTRISIVLI
jgi:hypothetical protein